MNDWCRRRRHRHDYFRRRRCRRRSQLDRLRRDMNGRRCWRRGGPRCGRNCLDVGRRGRGRPEFLQIAHDGSGIIVRKSGDGGQQDRHGDSGKGAAAYGRIDVFSLHGIADHWVTHTCRSGCAERRAQGLQRLVITMPSKKTKVQPVEKKRYKVGFTFFDHPQCGRPLMALRLRPIAITSSLLQNHVLSLNSYAVV